MKTVKLGDICEVIAGQSPVGSSYNDKEEGIELHQGKKLFRENEIQRSTVYTTQPTKIAEPGDILISVRAPVGPVNYTSRKICIGRGLAAIRAGDEVDKSFLFHFLRMNEANISGREGATFASINRKDIENITLPLPPLREQQQIVARLDATFEKIDRAMGLTKKNLRNAEELFTAEIKQIFADAPSKESLGEVITLQRGYDLPRRFRKAGEYKLVSSSGAIDTHNEFKVIGPGVYTGRSGSVGRTFYEESNFWPLNTTLYVKDFHGNNPRYCYWLLWNFDLVAFAGGTGVPTLNRNHVHAAETRVHPPEEQTELAEMLNNLSKQSQKLHELYQKKLDYLKALRQSLLHRAFSTTDKV